MGMPLFELPMPPLISKYVAVVLSERREFVTGMLQESWKWHRRVGRRLRQVGLLARNLLPVLGGWLQNENIGFWVKARELAVSPFRLLAYLSGITDTAELLRARDVNWRAGGE